MPAWTESFLGPDGALGRTDEGYLWELVRGSVSQRAGHGYAQPVSPGPFAVVAGSEGDEDGRLETTRPSAAFPQFGHALYFRVVDVSNYWRAFTRRTGARVPTGTTDAVPRLRLEVIVQGTAHLIGEAPIGEAGAGGLLAVDLTGDLVVATADLGATISSAGHPLRAAHLKARRHGFGFGEGTEYPYEVGVAALRWRPSSSGLYTPTAML